MVIKVKTKKRAFSVTSEECKTDTTVDKRKSLRNCPWENQNKERIPFAWNESFGLEADLRCKRF